MARNPRQPIVTKKHLARAERERRQRTYLLVASGVILALIAGLIGFGLLQQNVLRPRQAVATVNGERVTSEEFEDQTRYARYLLVSNAQNLLQFIQMFGGDAATAASFVQQLQQVQFQMQPTVVGQQMLDNMIDDVLIRQEAERRGITVSAEEIEQEFQEAFDFFPEGTPTATATLEPLPTSTLSALQQTLIPPTATATLEPTVEITATESLTGTPGADETAAVDLTPEAEAEATAAVTGEAEPTGEGPAAPTATQGPTATATAYTLDLYQERRTELLDNLNDQYGISPDDIRSVIERQVYREKVSEAVLEELNVERMQEQVWIREIVLPSEEAANDVLARLREGSDWRTEVLLAAQAQGFADAANVDGDLGWFWRGAAPYQDEIFEETAFELETGDMSEPVQISGQWHILQATGHEQRPLTGAELDELRQQRFQDWLADQREAAEIETFEIWQERVPTEPAFPPEAIQVIQAFQAQQQQQFAIPTPEAGAPGEEMPQATPQP